jgi:hypothetical protein
VQDKKGAERQRNGVRVGPEIVPFDANPL